jgi:hypothetical protein
MAFANTELKEYHERVGRHIEKLIWILRRTEGSEINCTKAMIIWFLTCMFLEDSGIVADKNIERRRSLFQKTLRCKIGQATLST